jgi:hypothetical protein
MRISFAIACAAITMTGALVASPGDAHAALLTPAPTGPGTEQVSPQGKNEGAVPGWEVSGAAGTGFGSTYGFGYEGRVGYTIPLGIYLGGQVQAFYGQNVNGLKAHAAFFGAELGYKWFPLVPLEIRPYVFAGPAFITQVDTNPNSLNSKTGFAVQPGGMALYHMGPAFVGADFRLLAAPSPFGVTLMGSGGVGF